MRNLLIAALLAGTAATPALAQESAPFTGPHIEALAGYDLLGAGDDDLDDGTDGFLYGVNAGYDFQLGGVIAGIEGEYTDSTTKARGSDLLVTGDRTELRTGRDLYVGGRLGVAAGASTMVYVKGGYTNAKFDINYRDATSVAELDLKGDGYRLGAGIEQKFNVFGPSGFVKAEYRYSNYGKLEVSNVNESVETDLDRHQALIGVGVRF